MRRRKHLLSDFEWQQYCENLRTRWEEIELKEQSVPIDFSLTDINKKEANNG
jgi:hypothetical protein